MSYLVLARKWRPQRFEDVIGQNHVTKTLQNAIKNDRLAHALLFSGPRGVGKTSVARIVAKALNCKKGPTPVPCNRCEICKRITAGNEIDVLEIDGASNRGIDEIRQLREEIKFRPVNCRYRVNIIDEVHMLTKEAFNALLKTLEEPPPHVYFIFATTEPQRIPATIHSRCQHYEFKRLNIIELKAHLKKISDAENLGLNEEGLHIIARQAKGSVRDSLSLLDQVAAFGATTAEEVCQALGIVETISIQQLATFILKRDVAKSLEIIDELYRFGVDLQSIIEQLIRYFRHLLIIKTVKDPKILGTLIDLVSEEIELAKELTKSYSYSDILQLLNKMLDDFDVIKKSTNPRIRVELLLISLCHMEEVVSLEDIISKLDNLSNIPLREGDKEKNSSYEENLYKTPNNSYNINDKLSYDDKIANQPKPCDSISLDSFVTYLKNTAPVIASVLEECKSIKIDSNNKLIIFCEHEWAVSFLKEEEHKKEIEKRFRELFHKELEVEIRLFKSDDIDQTNNKDSKKELMEHPLVQKAIDVFDARILRVDMNDFSLK